MDYAKDDATRAALRNASAAVGAAASARAATIAAAVQREADAAAAQRVAAAERAAHDAEAATAAHAAASASVPADVAALLLRLSLSAHGPALCDKLGVASCADLARLKEAHLKDEVPAMRVAERLRLLDAVAPAIVPAPAPTPVPAPSPPAPAPTPAPVAAPRVLISALVMGINAYAPPLPSLANAVADATAVHAALCALPGARSTLLTDCSKAALEGALTAFRKDCAARAAAVTATAAATTRGVTISRAQQPASAADVSERVLGIVFFAGHGLQVSGVNYLVPSDFQVPDANPKLEVVLKDTARACVSLEAVMETLDDAGVFVACALLDCCRNVPDFLPGAHRSAGSGGGGGAVRGGMGAITTPSLSAADAGGMLVAFATAPGQFARDASTRMPGHSPFTAALLASLRPAASGAGAAAGGGGLRLNDLHMFLRDEVHADTGGEQRPFISASFSTAAGSLLLA
jgi:hypothetical protein